MKEIKIAHLYYDLMNLYGENGNIRCLKEHLNRLNIKTTITNLSLEDKIDFSKYDIYYIGSGNNENFLLALENIKQYKEEIKEIINKKIFIITGNAINLFGKKYINNKKEYDCLNIFNYSSKEIKKRIVGEQLYRTNFIMQNIIGFENRSSILINNTENTLFEVIKGYGNSKNETFEGIKVNSFYGTYLLGPLLIRNPYLTDYLIKEICNKHNIDYKNTLNDIEIKAYDNYIDIINQK